MQSGKFWLSISAIIFAAWPAIAETGVSDLAARQAAAQAFLAARYDDKEVESISRTLAEDYVGEMQKLHPEISKPRLQALQKLIENNLLVTKSDYIDREANLYAEKLTLQDLQAATAFYKTPARKKLADPSLVPEIAGIQLAWTRAAVSKATSDLNAKAGSHK